MNPNITVKVSVSENKRTFRFNYSDLGITKEQWDEMGNDAKTEFLQQEIDDIPEPPYWVVDTFETTES